MSAQRPINLDMLANDLAEVLSGDEYGIDVDAEDVRARLVPFLDELTLDLLTKAQRFGMTDEYAAGRLDKTKLSVNRRIMLRLIAFDKVTLDRDGALDVSYRAERAGNIDGHGARAIEWLSSQGFVRCTGPAGLFGTRSGPMTVTDKGKGWLDANGVTC